MIVISRAPSAILHSLRSRVTLFYHNPILRWFCCLCKGNRAMSDEPAYIRNFKTYSGDDPAIDDLENLERELYGANDRAAAILLGAFC
jgi:hypothetical protein